MGAFPQCLSHRQLSALRRFHVPKPPRKPIVFQKGSEAVYRDELRRAAKLHPRPAAERVRRGALACATQQEALVSPHHADHGRAGHSVLAFDRKKGIDHRSRGCCWNCSDVHRRNAVLRGHGRSKPSTRGISSLVAGPDLRPRGWLSNFESTNVEDQWSVASGQWLPVVSGSLPGKGAAWARHESRRARLQTRGFSSFTDHWPLTTASLHC